MILVTSIIFYVLFSRLHNCNFILSVAMAILSYNQKIWKHIFIWYKMLAKKLLELSPNLYMSYWTHYFKHLGLNQYHNDSFF